jgi:predicted DCC family thiol-disulfide oxidoreductase YuxK
MGRREMIANLNIWFDQYCVFCFETVLWLIDEVLDVFEL